MAGLQNTSNSRGAGTKRVWGLILKELRLLLKDKFAMIIIFLLPIMLVIVIQPPPWGVTSSSSNGSGSNATEIPFLGYIDLDQSEGMKYENETDLDLSNEIVGIMREFTNNGTAMFILGSSITELDEWLGKGNIHAYVVLPDGLERNISIHFPGIFIVKFDTINSLLLEGAQGVVEDLQLETKSRFNLTGVFNQQIFEVGQPEIAQTLFQVAPIFFPLTLFAIAALTTAQSIVADVPKDRVLMTPANKFEIIASKLIANEIMVAMQAAILTGMSYGLVGLVTIGSPFMLFGILLLVGLSGVCLGLAISALVSTPLSALQLFIFVFLFQMMVMLFLEDPVMLSIFPMYNGLQLTMNLVMRGEDFTVSGILPTLYIVLWIAGFFTLTLIAFHRRKSML